MKYTSVVFAAVCLIPCLFSKTSGSSLLSSMRGRETGAQDSGLEQFEDLITSRDLANVAPKPTKSPTKKPSGGPKGGKSKSKGKGKPPPPPINQLCFTKLAAIWRSWSYCYLDLLTTADNSCPIQDNRVPAQTTFLYVDRQPQNCSSFKPNERNCTIPADNWIVLPAATGFYSTDFVNPEYANNEDTPEGSLTFATEVYDNYKKVTATVVQQIGNTTEEKIYDPPPFYESQDLCNLEMLDLKGCTGNYTFLDDWYVASVGNWLRIAPLGKGIHTIEVKTEGFICQLPTNENCPDPDFPPYECAGTKYTITAV